MGENTKTKTPQPTLNLSHMMTGAAMHERPKIELDIEKYQSYLDHSDMSAQEKEDFLQWLWVYIITLVDIGYGVHPLQKATRKDLEIEAGRHSSNIPAHQTASAAISTLSTSHEA